MGEGREPPHILRDPKTNRFSHLIVLSEVIPGSVDWKDHARQRESEVLA